MDERQLHRCVQSAGRSRLDDTHGKREFKPIFALEFFERQTLPREVNDPLYPKVTRAWDQVTGKGIRVAVVGHGLEIGHEDMTNAYPLESNFHRNCKEDAHRPIRLAQSRPHRKARPGSPLSGSLKESYVEQ
jgi:hypothetical protein